MSKLITNILLGGMTIGTLGLLVMSIILMFHVTKWLIREFKEDENE